MWGVYVRKVNAPEASGTPLVPDRIHREPAVGGSCHCHINRLQKVGRAVREPLEVPPWRWLARPGLPEHAQPLWVLASV